MARPSLHARLMVVSLGCTFWGVACAHSPYNVSHCERLEADQSVNPRFIGQLDNCSRALPGLSGETRTRYAQVVASSRAAACDYWIFEPTYETSHMGSAACVVEAAVRLGVSDGGEDTPLSDIRAEDRLHEILPPDWDKGVSILRKACALNREFEGLRNAKAACFMLDDLARASGDLDARGDADLAKRNLEYSCMGTTLEKCRRLAFPRWTDGWVSSAVRELGAAALVARIEKIHPSEVEARLRAVERLRAITTPPSTPTLARLRATFDGDQHTLAAEGFAAGLASLDQALARGSRASPEALAQLTEAVNRLPVADQPAAQAAIVTRAKATIAAWHALGRAEGQWLKATREAHAVRRFAGPEGQALFDALRQEGGNAHKALGERHQAANRVLLARLHLAVAGSLLARVVERPTWDPATVKPRVVVRAIVGTCPWLTTLPQTTGSGPAMTVDLALSGCTSVESRAVTPKVHRGTEKVWRKRTRQESVFVPGSQTCLWNGRERVCSGSQGHYESRTVKEDYQVEVPTEHPFNEHLRTLRSEVTGTATFLFAGRTWSQPFAVAAPPEEERLLEWYRGEALRGTPSTMTLPQHQALARGSVQQWLEGQRTAVERQMVVNLADSGRSRPGDEGDELLLQALVLGQSEPEGMEALAARQGLGREWVALALDGRVTWY